MQKMVVEKVALQEEVVGLHPVEASLTLANQDLAQARARINELTEELVSARQKHLDELAEM